MESKMMMRNHTLFTLAAILFLWMNPIEYLNKVVFSQTQNQHDIIHRFQSADQWAKRFENPDRDEWQKPDEVISAMGIEVNTLIADIGSATGYFPVRFAKVATKGYVFGIDIEKDMIRFLNERAELEELENLESVLGQPDDPHIPKPVDIIFLCNTYHHIEHRIQYFQNLKKYFLPNGKLIIVDFKKGDFPVGPSDNTKLSKAHVIEELTTAGYKLMQENFMLPYQYFLLFKTPSHD
jgi:SAM-dependent methyltransferase